MPPFAAAEPHSSLSETGASSSNSISLDINTVASKESLQVSDSNASHLSTYTISYFDSQMLVEDSFSEVIKEFRCSRQAFM